jgi:hypothetical protein
VKTDLTFDIKRYAPDFTIEIDGKIQNDLRRNVISITIEDSIEMPSTFNLNLYEKLDGKDKSLKWMDNDLLDPMNPKDVNIYIYYANSSTESATPIISGLIVALNPGFPSSGVPSLSVQGYDRSFLLQKPRKRADFAAEEDLSSIIAKIAGSFGLKFDRTQGPKIKPKEKLNIDPQETDYTYLRNLADRFGYEFFIRSDTIYFREPAFLENEKLTIAWGKEIMSFSPRMSNAGIIAKATVSGYCHKNKEKHKIVASATLEDLSFKENGAVSAIKALRSNQKTGTSEIFKHNCPVGSMEEAKEMAKSMLMKANYNLIEGTCECIGLPNVRAGTNVLIENVGRKLSGKYYIKKASHNIGEGGYNTTLEVCRGGFGNS